MSSATYSVIRYIPDPGRGERLNIGILAWDEEGFRLKLDDKAIERVIRENPLLDRDALRYVEPLLNEGLSTAIVPVPVRIERMLEGQKGFPIDLSEPRFTSLQEDGGLDVTVDRLTQRIVRPKRRTGGSGLNTVETIERRLKPLIATEVVSRNHFFGHSRTGVPRAADFFANSGANVALDVVKLALKRADEIRLRSDAEAFKVYDVFEAENEIKSYVVFCELNPIPELEEINHDARKVIEMQGATIVTDLVEAAQALEQAVS